MPPTKLVDANSSRQAVTQTDHSDRADDRLRLSDVDLFHGDQFARTSGGRHRLSASGGG